MRLVATKSVQAGERLGKIIYGEHGKPLLHQGVRLTGRMLERLIEYGIHYIYIEDDRTSDILFEEVITEKTKQVAIQTIKSEFNHIAEQVKFKNVIHGDRLSVDLGNVVQSILTDIKGNEAALGILSDVYAYDNYVFAHSLNVTIYTLGLAVKLKFTEKQLMEIGIGALLHDVGKMTIPTELLNKPSKLTDEEFELIKSHTVAGYDMIKEMPNISLKIARCALLHHERENGSGYPFGLCGEEIDEYAKIIGIADVFDAVTSYRAYRKPMLPHEGLDLLYSGVGTLYDLHYIKMFKQTIAVYPIGLTVTLSDWRTAIVVKQNQQLSTHPVVRVIAEDGVEIAEPYDVDLEKNMNVTIVAVEAGRA